VPARQKVPQGQSLLIHGFVKVGVTVKTLNRDFRKGLRWYFLGLIFAEAAVNAFTVVSVVYLDEHIGLTGTEIGIFFLLTLLASLPGSRLGAFITHRTDPSRSYRLSMACLFLVTAMGAVLVDLTTKSIAYVWAVFTGVLLGWFYPVENLYFSMALPKDQEAEYSGFFVYCTQILGWAPPLLFSILVEANVSQTVGVISVALFLLIAICILSFAAPWPEILEESKPKQVDDKESNVMEDPLESVNSTEDPSDAVTATEHPSESVNVTEDPSVISLCRTSAD
jgi:MFS-type transporter involved in bile tolerance (Atg22 family)